MTKAEQIAALLTWELVHAWARQQEGFLGYLDDDGNGFSMYLDEKTNRLIWSVGKLFVKYCWNDASPIIETPAYVRKALCKIDETGLDEINAEQFLSILEQCKPEEQD